MRKRDFLTAGFSLGAGLAASTLMARAQTPAAPQAAAAPAARRTVPTARARTTKLFKSPGLFPNALAASPDGLWIGQQKNYPAQAAAWGVSMPSDPDEAAWLVDWNGNLKKTLVTHSRNTSGIAWGNNAVWMGANTDPWGIFQIDPNGRELGHRQIPLSLNGDGGGCHGLKFRDGKLWIAALRLGGALRVDPATWTPEVLIPVASQEKPRLHDIALDPDGNLWVVTGNNSRSYAEGKPGLNKYDAKTGQLVMTVEFEPGSCDPHGLEFHDGKLISCDAGNHPNWKENESPTSGWIFSIDMI
jgi:sugar lactone lactonase YvrE